MTTEYIHDPESVLDYNVDWNTWLQAGETISSSSVTVPSGITKNSDNNALGIQTAWMTGGTRGTRYALVFHITTSAGRQEDRTLTLSVQDK